MNSFDQIRESLMTQTNTVYQASVDLIPKVVVTLILVLIGYFIAISFKKIVKKFFKKIKINTLVSKTNLDETLKEAGIKMDLAEFFGEFTKWIIYIITLLFIVDYLNLNTIQEFITKILSSLGTIILGLVVFGITVYVARFAQAIAEAIGNYIELKNPKIIANVVTGLIYFIGLSIFVEILNLEIIKEIIIQLTGALIYGTAIAFGLAFGLGGKEKAQEVIESYKSKKKK